MTPLPHQPYRALTIAASDSSGAAGVQADLKTFEARGVYGLCALTAITAQDSQTIYALHALDPLLISRQVRAVLADIGADAVKTGLLLYAPVIESIREALNASGYGGPLVVDPVLIAGDGRPLADDAAIAAYRQHIFPLAAVITPNLGEASILLGSPLKTVEDMCAAAKSLKDSTKAAAVLIKGGHLEGEFMADVLYDGVNVQVYPVKRLPLINPRGTGCTYSACLTAELAQGQTLSSALEKTIRYLAVALESAAMWSLGAGRGTIHHSVGRPPLFSNIP